MSSTPSPGRLTLAARISLHPGKEAAFDELEERAAAIMAKHEGRIESRVRSRPGEEVHLVTFPDRAAFERYRRDPETLALAELRATIVRETVLWMGSA